MLAYVHQFLHSLLFSMVVESVAVFALCLVCKRDKRIAYIAALGTALTIPYVWFVFPTVFWYSSATALFLAEAFAFLFEAFLYKVLGKLDWRYAFLFSFVANCASYFLGRVF
jgi:hypothetical protein